MQPRKHLLATCSVLLIAALLAACAAPAAAPTATPVPPTDTPMPPAAESDPVMVVQAWADAIYSGDVDAALDLFADDGNYLIYYTAYGKESMRWVFDWLAGLETKFEIVNCQPEGDTIACDLIVLDGCMAASGSPGLPSKAVFTLQDGKIKEATGYGTGPEWNAYWDFVSIVQSWERAFRPEEMAKIVEGTQEGGAIAIKLCREYENAVKTQEPATAVAAQGLVDALNSGDVDAALALFTDDAKFGMLNDKAVGAEQLRSMFDWLADKETQYQISDCEWQGIAIQCAVSVTDGCIAASGAADGLHGTMVFFSEENGTLRQVNIAPKAVERKAYETWLEAESAWASANRAGELGQAEGYSQEAGAMVVKLCREYAAAPKLDDAKVAEIEAIVGQAMTNYSLPGLAIGIVKDGNVLYAKGFGEGNVAEGNPVKPQSLFGLASISKMFTAAAIMQLAEQGLINLDAPVTDYLPYFRLDDPRYDEITVRQLLAHTSGLPWLPAQTEVRWEELGFHDPDTEEGALERMVRSLDSVALVADPGGDQVMYSNTAFDVLGDIVAKVSGQSYEAYMRDNIFEPLGMDQSSFALDEADPELLTTGYQRDLESGDLTAWEIFPFNPQHSPSAGLISNIDDMNRWALALLNQGELDGERVLEAESLDQMWSPSATMGWGGLLQDYGLGWILAEDAGHRFAWHVGGVPGFTSNLILAPDDGIAVVTLVNLNNYLTDEPWYATEVGTAIMVALLDIGQ